MFSNAPEFHREPATIARRLPGCTLLAALLLAAATTVAAAGTGQPPAPPIIELPAGSVLDLISGANRAGHALQRPAAVIPVTNCNDAGAGTLRSVISGADDGDTVDLSGLTCGTILLESAITVSKGNLTLQGPLLNPDGSPALAIDGQEAHRIFLHTVPGILQIKNLWLRDGFVESDAFGGTGAQVAEGGCIYSWGSIYLERSVVSGCMAKENILSNLHANSYGGAIRTWGNAGLKNSIVRDNTIFSFSASAVGGGVYTNGTLVMADSVLENNDATSGIAAYGGGAVTKQLLLDSSMVRGNTAEVVNGDKSSGGGIFLSFSASGPAVQSVISNAQFLDNLAKAPPSATTTGKGGGLATAEEPTGGTHTVMIGDSLFRGNEASYLGGAIFTRFPLVLARSTLANNKAGRRGGGMVADIAGIFGSTIARNDAMQGGGLVLGMTDAGQTNLVVQSTISRNRATWYGGGLLLTRNAEVWNSTITDNAEIATEATGAGIVLSSTAQLKLKSSIVAGNFWQPEEGSATRADSDLSYEFGIGWAVQGDYNLLGEIHTVMVPETIGDIGIADPELEPLAYNGGPTRTHLPRADSLAIDAGADNGYTVDQRGTGYARVVGPQADIGAVERDDDRIFRHDFDYEVVAL